MTTRDIGWLMPKATGWAGSWYITICGFDCSEPPATAILIWPEDEPLKIPNKMVMMTVAAFADLQHRAQQSSTGGVSEDK